MREALAAADHDYILTDPPRPRRKSTRAKPQAKRRRNGFSALKTHRVFRIVVGSLCVAALGGIALNALSLQKARHPAPLFARGPRPVVASQPAVALPAGDPVSTQRPVPDAPNRVENAPVAKFTAGGEPEAAAPNATHPVAPDEAPHDAISRLLLGKASEAEPPQSTTPAKTVLAVQRALVKLGYVLKADGVMGATTRQAIEHFEHEHHRASDGELTPAVLQRLGVE